MNEDKRIIGPDTAEMAGAAKADDEAGAGTSATPKPRNLAPAPAAIGDTGGSREAGKEADLRMVPQLNQRFLTNVAVVLLGLFVVLVWLFGRVAHEIGLFDRAAPGSRGGLGVIMAAALAVLGAIALVGGVFVAAAELRRPGPWPVAPSEHDAAKREPPAAKVAADVVEKLGTAFAALSGSAALLFTAVLLLGGAGLLGWQSLPDKPCELISTAASPPAPVVVAATTSCQLVPAGPAEPPAAGGAASGSAGPTGATATTAVRQPGGPN